MIQMLISDFDKGDGKEKWPLNGIFIEKYSF